MKIRIRGNSVRVRVSKTELADFGSRGSVTDRVCFDGDSELIYRLAVDDRAREPHADFTGRTITVRLPRSMADEWVNSDQVSLRSEQGIAGGEQLRILVEKDFECLAPREDEDDSDAFPHPQAGQETC